MWYKIIRAFALIHSNIRRSIAMNMRYGPSFQGEGLAPRTEKKQNSSEVGGAMCLVTDGKQTILIGVALTKLKEKKQKRLSLHFPSAKKISSNVDGTDPIEKGDHCPFCERVVAPSG